MKTGNFFARTAATLLFAAALAEPATASCSWSFNWYCGSSGCARNMGRSSGTVGGFGSAEQCEAARSNWRRQSINTGSCDRSGVCEAPGGGRPTPGGGRTPQGGDGTPDYDPDAAHRRFEEERMRQEAEDAERRAREKAEADRQQRQFAADKIDTLKSLKGADFDGGGARLKGGDDGLQLKGGSETLGIKSNPGKSAPQQVKESAAEKGSRFSKGSQFSAPVDLSTKDPAGPLTVDSGPARELIPDGQLGQFVAAQPWPTPIKGQTAVALIDLERGRAERAAARLKAAAKAQPKDEFLRRAAARAAEEAKTPRLKFDPERFAKQLPKTAYHAYVAAWEELEKGNINGAARLFGRALDAAPNNAALQQLVAETEKRRRILSPEEQRQAEQRRERGRDYAQANAALFLAYNAMDRNSVLALSYLDEAAKKFSGLEWEFIRITKQQVADQAREPSANMLMAWTYHYPNRGEAILDALEYGRGDWAASLRYLKHAGQIQKGNPVVDAAYRDLERLSKEAPSQ